MAPTKPPRVDKDKRLKSILSFTADLEVQLPTAISSPSHKALFNDLQKHVLEFPPNLGPSAASKCEEIDRSGTSLWNLCTRLRRNYESDNLQDIPIILPVARVFAFQLLDVALETGKSTTANTLRLMKIGIKAAKNCIEVKSFDLAKKVLERLGAFEIKLGNPDTDSPIQDREVHQRLIAEYYILRTAHAWHQDQLDVADFMFKKSMSSPQIFDPNTAESLADILFEMGKDLIYKKEHKLAVKWLDRALEVLMGQELDRLSMDASELRISIIESCIKANLGLHNQEAAERARVLVESLENEVGDKLIVLLMKLDLVSSATDETFDSNLYADILRRMTRSTILNTENFKLIMHHIRKLNDKSPSLACKALDELLKLRILPEDKEEWIEKVLITRLYMTVGQRDGMDALISLEALFSMIVTNIKQPISSAATLAAHTLLWKKIESSYTQKQNEMTEKWCRLALHQIFENSGELNVARISRKLLLCALETQDFASARDTYGSMSETAKNEPMTRFLMYKVAIRCDELDFAAECLQIISTVSPNDPTLLYACVLDAQQIGNRPQTLAALQLVLEKFGYGASSTIHLPSLLRLTIGLTVELIDKSKVVEGSPKASQTVEKLCRLFEGGVASLHKAPRITQPSETVWTIAELDWFSKNSYNLSIDNLSRWAPRHSLRMLQCCISFIDQYPLDIGEQISDDLSLRKMFCEFSAATALVALARGEDNNEIYLQDYLTLRKHVASFDNLLQNKLDKMEEGPAQDLLQKLSVLIAFDFEAACQLKAWDDLGEVILKAEVCKEIRVYELMADCILSSQPPTEVLVTTLKKIVNEAWGLGTLDSIKLAKYMRCLFQVALSDSPETAQHLLEQICNLAEEAAETEQPYPVEELEWVATRTFNYAIDLYCSENDEGCKNWAAQALNIAHFCADGGALERLLQSKWAGLKFGVEV